MLEDIGARPYFIRAVYQWCVDKGHTPHVLAVWREGELRPGDSPRLKGADGKIVFNISPAATRNLTIGDNGVFFSARFAGTTTEVGVPLRDVLAIYGREVGKGVSFPPIAESPAALKAAATSKSKKPSKLRIV